MEKRFTGKFFTTFFIVCALSMGLLCCGKTNLGGVDGGGGHLLSSKPSQVEAIFDNKSEMLDDLSEILTNLFRLVNANKSNNPLLKKFVVTFDERMRPFSKNVQGYDEENRESCLKTIADTNDLKEMQFNEGLVSSPQSECQAFRPRVLLEEVKMKRIYPKACKDMKGRKRPAAVSKFNLTGVACFSQKELKVTPVDALRKQVYALYIHELGHLLGFETEEEGVFFQTFVANNYDILFKSKNPNYSVYSELASDLRDIAPMFQKLSSDRKLKKPYSEGSFDINDALYREVSMLLQKSGDIEKLAKTAADNLEKTKPQDNENKDVINELREIGQQMLMFRSNATTVKAYIADLYHVGKYYQLADMYGDDPSLYNTDPAAGYLENLELQAQKLAPKALAFKEDIVTTFGVPLIDTESLATRSDLTISLPPNLHGP
jgi:hypothetical protein